MLDGEAVGTLEDGNTAVGEYDGAAVGAVVGV